MALIECQTCGVIDDAEECAWVRAGWRPGDEAPEPAVCACQCHDDDEEDEDADDE